MGPQLGLTFRLLKRANLVKPQWFACVSSNKLWLCLSIGCCSVPSVYKHFSKSESYFWHLVSVCSGFLESRLPNLCLIYPPGFVSSKLFPSSFHIFYMSPRSFLASLCWKKISFNSNFHTGSLLKEWCSVPCGIAVRSICHWQDYLRKNICQTHRELGLWILITRFQAMTFWVQRQGILLVNKPLN